MNKSFGLTYEVSQKVKVEGYESRIPATLEMLKRYFLEYEGQNVVGIFRLSANKDEVDQAKEEINTGKFNGCDDVHIISNLIKVCICISVYINRVNRHTCIWYTLILPYMYI